MKQSIISLILMFVLAACANGELKTVSPTETNTVSTNEASITLNSSTLLPEITSTQQPTDAPTSILTPTQKITLTPTVPPMWTPHPRCSDSGESFQNNVEFPGQIYIWAAFPKLYAVVATPYLSVPLEPAIPQTLGPNNRSMPISFSRYSEKVAYITRGEKNNLWVADEKLCIPEHIWEDESDWLGKVSTDTDIQVIWGPNDNSIILRSLISPPHITVYSMTTGEIVQWSGNCDTLAKSTISEKLALWCSTELNGGSGYGIIEANGSFNTSISLPESNITHVVDWSYSPNGEHIIYSTDQNEVFIVDNDENKIKLPIIYDSLDDVELTLGFNRRGLQWSQDGTQVLVLGDQGWILFNSSTGNIIYKIVPFTNLDATLSPDGKWIVTSAQYVDGLREFFLLSVPSGEKIILGDFIVSLVSWGK